MTFHQRLMGLLALHLFLVVWAMFTAWSWWYVLLGLAVGKIFNVLGNECGLHRLWCHKSYTTARWKEYVLHAFAVPLLYGSSIVYAGIHRQHHAYADTERDPHITRPWWKVVFYMRNKNYAVESRFVSDLTRDSLHRWLHRNYFAVNVAILTVCLLILGPEITGWTLSFQAIYNFAMAGMVNVLGHRPEYGSRTFETNDQSSNNKLVQFISWNEGLHNHHHRNPGSWDFRVKSGEIDFPALIIERFLRQS